MEARHFLPQYGPGCCCEGGMHWLWGWLSMARLGTPWPLLLRYSEHKWSLAHSQLGKMVIWVWMTLLSILKDFQSTKLTFISGVSILPVPLVSFPPRLLPIVNCCLPLRPQHTWAGMGSPWEALVWRPLLALLNHPVLPQCLPPGSAVCWLVSSPLAVGFVKTYFSSKESAKHTSAIPQIFVE